MANAAISLADIAALAALLAVVSFYTTGNTRLTSYLPQWMTKDQSLEPAVLLLAFFLIKNLLSYFVYTLQTRYVYGVASRISRNQILRYLNSPYKDYVNIAGSVQHHEINHQPIEFGHYVLSGIQQIITECTLILLALTAIILYNAKLFLVLMLFLMPAIMLAAWLMRRRLRSARANVKQDAGMAMQYLQEALHSYIESHIYGKKQFFTDRYYQYQKRLNEHLAGVQIAQWIPGRFVEVFAVCGLFLLIVINQQNGTLIDAVGIGAFVAAAYKIIPGVGRIATLSSQIRTYRYTLDHLSKEDHSVKASRPPVEAQIREVAFHDVSFRYGDTPVFEKLNATITAGDFVCLSAISGRGKTTLLNLLLGFLPQESGQILFNGQETDMEERMAWQRRIAYVKQQNFLIHDSITQNITLTEDAIDESRLALAVQKAGLKPLIESFPERLNKVIADNGKDVSGGQRQRIAIARAFYKDADLYVFDEPFNELDKEAEHCLLQHLNELARAGKIVLLVSHGEAGRAFCNKTIHIDA